VNGLGTLNGLGTTNRLGTNNLDGSDISVGSSGSSSVVDVGLDDNILNGSLDSFSDNSVNSLGNSGLLLLLGSIQCLNGSQQCANLALQSVNDLLQLSSIVAVFTTNTNGALLDRACSSRTSSSSNGNGNRWVRNLQHGLGLIHNNGLRSSRLFSSSSSLGLLNNNNNRLCLSGLLFNLGGFGLSGLNFSRLSVFDNNGLRSISSRSSMSGLVFNDRCNSRVSSARCFHFIFTVIVTFGQMFKCRYDNGI